MDTVALTIPRRQALVTNRPHPLLSVLEWELRRLFAGRTWIFAIITFGVLLLVLWLQRETGIVAIQVAARTAYGGQIAYASTWDLLDKLGSGTVAILTIVLFFVCTDAIPRDIKRRTHELLMATPLPDWSYVWGRYLSVVLISLVLAVELLMAIVAMAVIMHLTIGGEIYPAPQLGQIFIVWASFVLPILFFFGSLSFALGTFLPRFANLIKTALFVAWFVMSFILLAALNNQLASWYTNWDPTGGNINEGSPDRYRNVYIHQLHAAGLYHLHQTAATSTWALQALHTLEYQLVDFWSWFGPHLIWDGLALTLVILAVFRFQRFRNA